MNKILYFTFVLFCFAVSSKCNVISEESTIHPRNKTMEEIVEEKCIEVTGDHEYMQKLMTSIDSAITCLWDAVGVTFDEANDKNSSEAAFLELICEKREVYYSCLSIGLDAYGRCLTQEENVDLLKIRKVFRRIISQICEADIVKIIEFLSGDGLACYKNNLDNISETLTSMFNARQNQHLPSSYINDQTCVDLTKLHQELKPVINLCENKSPGIFLQNLISAIEEEISCESVNLTHDDA